jgi:hypothetical protein
MKKPKAAPKPKVRPAKREPREDMNQIAYRVMQETIRRTEGK